MGRLTAIVLGSAAGGAFPQWNCGCAICARARRGDPAAKARTQASLAISSDSARWTLLNASPDLGAQIRTTPSLQAREGTRSSPIAAVVLTGGEIDQVTGLLSLREGTPFSLYATAATHAALADNPIFGALTATTRHAVAPGQTFSLPCGAQAELFTVPGKVPLYLEGEAPEIEESAVNVGVEIRSGDARLLYVPGAAAATPAMLQRFAKVDAVLFDGTLFTDDEMIRTHTGTKTGRRMGHMPVDGEGGTLHALAQLKARRVFIHINNTNPILLDDSPERARVVAAGWEVAHDGMEIVL